MLSSLLSRLPYSKQQYGKTPDYEFVFILHPNNKGWILEAICREVATRLKGSSHIEYHRTSSRHTALPSAQNYFFSHYLHYLSLIDYDFKGAKKLIWYTHPRSTDMDDSELAQAFNKADAIFFHSKTFAEHFIRLGLKPEKSFVVLGAADPEIFYPHERTGKGKIGFVSSYYERKNPDLIYALVKAMKHREFILVGKDWEKYPHFNDMQKCPNFSYVTPSYQEYPAYYDSMDVFVSPSYLEGGPIPLVEAMMANVVPVASNTGFSTDLISHNMNGYIFDPYGPVEDVITLIEQAFKLPTDVRATVEHLTWDRLTDIIINRDARK